MFTQKFTIDDIEEMKDTLKLSDTHLKVAEIFSTVQGEGPNTGIPVVFVRLQLCNLKCFWCDSILKGTLILTERRGWVPIEKIKEGEEIIGVTQENSHPHQNRQVYTKAIATNLVHHIDDEGVKIVTDDGNSIMCTRNHLIFVRRNYKWIWEEAKNIKENDTLWSISHGNLPTFMPSTSDYEEGWIAGYDIGDGGWSNQFKKYRRYESVDSQILDRLELYLNMKKVRFTRRTRQIKTGTIYQLDSHYIPDVTMLFDLPSKSRFLGPLGNKNVEWHRGFIAGFFDAEGFNNDSLVCIAHQNEELLKYIQKYLHYHFELSSRISEKNIKDNCYRLTVFGGVLGRLKFDAIFQYSKYSHREKWLWHSAGRRGAKGKNISRQSKQKVKVIQVEHIEHDDPQIYYDIGSSCGNFIANGIVVHNTPYTWNWEGTDFKHDTKDYEKVKYDPRDEIISMTPEQICQEVEEKAGTGIKHIVLTGGEPLMQQRSPAFLNMLKLLFHADFKIEIETNGTIKPSNEVVKYITQFNVSPKLENSGNPLVSRRKDRAYEFYTSQHHAYFKFVVESAEDLEEILGIQRKYNIPADKILLMPQGRTEEETKEKAQEIVELCKQHGYRFCNRLQVWIWDGALRGV